MNAEVMHPFIHLPIHSFIRQQWNTLGCSCFWSSTSCQTMSKLKIKHLFEMESRSATQSCQNLWVFWSLHVFFSSFPFNTFQKRSRALPTGTDGSPRAHKAKKSHQQIVGFEGSLCWFRSTQHPKLLSRRDTAEAVSFSGSSHDNFLRKSYSSWGSGPMCLAGGSNEPLSHAL